MKLCTPLFFLLFTLLQANLYAQQLSELDWLAGYWSSSDNETKMEEFWSAPKGGIIIGMHRDVFSNGHAFFEYLRIQKIDNVITYFASPRGSKPTAFYLVSLEDELAIFENLEHDSPQRIVYRREGNELHVGIEQADGSKAMAWVWTLTTINN